MVPMTPHQITDDRYEVEPFKDRWNLRIVSGTHVGWSGGIFATAEAAEVELGIRYRLAALANEIPATIDRTTYERLCAEHGIEPKADRLIAGSGVSDFVGYTGMVDADGSYRTFALVMLRRAAGIAAERPAPVPTSAPARDDVACPNCGRIVARSLLMSASLGTACPDCFDDLSG